MQVDEKPTTILDLVQPEIFTPEDIIKVLKARGVDVTALHGEPKEKLVEEYYKYACPQPQRKYRSNRRGIDLSRKQIQVSKRKRTQSEENGSGTYTIQGKSSTNTVKASGLVNSYLPVGDRLKAPPSAINLKRKIISLGGSKSTVPEQNNVEMKATKHIVVSPTSKLSSPISGLNSDLSIIKINCKDYSKEESDSNTNEGSKDLTPKNNTLQAPSEGHTSGKIRLKKPSDTITAMETNGAASSNNTKTETHSKQHETMQSTGTNNDDVPVKKNKFQRVDIKFP